MAASGTIHAAGQSAPNPQTGGASPTRRWAGRLLLAVVYVLAVFSVYSSAASAHVPDADAQDCADYSNPADEAGWQFVCYLALSQNQHDHTLLTDIAAIKADVLALKLAAQSTAADVSLLDSDTNPLLAQILAELQADNEGTGTTASVVSLASSDRERLDLQWWGTWAVVGLLFVLMLAPRWFSAFRVTRGA